MLGRHAAARVFHADPDAVVHAGRRHGDPAPIRGVAHGVGDQVLQRLLEPAPVGAHAPGAGLDRGAKLDAPRGRRHAVPLGDAIEQRGHRHVGRLDVHAAAFEPRQVQQVADERLEALRLLGDDSQVALAGRLVANDRRHGQRLEIAADGRQRRHQLVRDVGQQLAAHQVGLVQLVEARLELGRHPVERRRQGRDLVAAALGRARRRVAGPQGRRGGFQRSQPAAGGRQDEEHDPQRAHHQQQRAGSQQRRAVGGQRRLDGPARRQHRHPPAHLAARTHGRKAPAAEPRAGRPVVVERDALAANRGEHDVGHRKTAVGDDAAVGEQDEDVLRGASERIAEQVFQVGAGVRLDSRAQVLGNQPRQPDRRAGEHRSVRLPDDPDDDCRLDGQQQQHERERAKGHTPVQAPVPRLRCCGMTRCRPAVGPPGPAFTAGHRPPCSPCPRP